MKLPEFQNNVRIVSIKILDHSDVHTADSLRIAKWKIDHIRSYQ